MHKIVANSNPKPTVSRAAMFQFLWLTAAARNPLDFLADQLFNETWQMRVKPAAQHALQEVLGHVLDGALPQSPRHQGVGKLVEGGVCRIDRFGRHQRRRW